jgi:hypothetical protein
MEEVIVVEDRIDMQCMRHVHLMSNQEIEKDELQVYGIPSGVGTREAGAWHLRCSYPYRGMIDIPAASKNGKFRRLVAWNLDGCPSVKVALHDAAMEFERLFGGRAEFGFVRKLPKGAEHGMEVGDLILLETEWMLDRCVAVGCKALYF